MRIASYDEALSTKPFLNLSCREVDIEELKKHIKLCISIILPVAMCREWNDKHEITVVIKNTL